MCPPGLASASTACINESATRQMSPDQRHVQGSHADEMRRLKAELKGVTEERDMLKNGHRACRTSLRREKHVQT